MRHSVRSALSRRHSLPPGGQRAQGQEIKG